VPLNSIYSKFQAKSDNYTVLAGDDVIVFTIATAKTATLPLAGTCPFPQNVKQITSAGGSADTLTIAVTSPDTLIGASTLAAGQSTFVTANAGTWTSVSGGGQAGYSGYSGISGPSGFSGYSGISGFSGYSGISGFSGYSGTSGYSGYSGKSGNFSSHRNDCDDCLAIKHKHGARRFRDGWHFDAAADFTNGRKSKSRNLRREQIFQRRHAYNCRLQRRQHRGPNDRSSGNWSSVPTRRPFDVVYFLEAKP